MSKCVLNIPMTNNYGLNDSYKYMELELDSLDADQQGNASSTKLDWPLFNFDSLANVAAIKILEAQIPFSYYVITPENASFTMLAPSPTQYTVTLVTGNYNVTTLTTELARALNAVGGAQTFTVTFNTSLGKFIFNSTGAFSFTFGLATNAGNVNPRLYIGFPGGTTTSSGNAITAPNIALVSGPNYLYVNSEKIGGLVSTLLPNGAVNLSNGGRGPQIAKVGVNTLPGGVINWADPDPQKWFSLSDLSNVSSLDFYLTLGNTTSQKPLRLNGLSFSLKVGLLLVSLDKMDILSGLPHQDRATKRFRLD